MSVEWNQQAARRSGRVDADENVCGSSAQGTVSCSVHDTRITLRMVNQVRIHAFAAASRFSSYM